MSKKLLPCPFCGGEAEIERMGTRRQSCQVACTNCGAHHEGPDEDEHSGDSWNRRAALDWEWQSERPDEGDWYMSLPVAAREARWEAVEFVHVDDIGSVWSDSPGLDGGHIGYLGNPLFQGALWQRRTVPRDPFGGGGE